MYLNSGYLNHSRIPYKDKSKPLIVSSCGTYRLKTKERLPTWRPRGRLDYQLLYVSSGKAHFFINGEDIEVSSGNMVIFLPRQEQHYEYYGKDKTEVYWVHFTGSDVKNILKKCEIPLDENIFYSGSSASYTAIFKEMIHEFQTCNVGYEKMTEMYLKQLFITIQRTRKEQKTVVMSSYLQNEMQYARRYFIDHYNENINIESFARSRNMSVSWFLRNFKQTTKLSPMQYILNIRMNNAVALLQSTDYNITEISSIVGYDNPLYFSRVFKKATGVSPSDYKRTLHRDG